MSSIVVIGATGFLGRALILCNEVGGLPIKAISRRMPTDPALLKTDVAWYAVDVLQTGVLDSILESGDVVANLLYIEGKEQDNFIALQNIIDSCEKAEVSRLIHCSTAVVAGATDHASVTELTICKPKTKYECIKYKLEQQLLASKQVRFDFAILRPTAIVGPGGKNLMKLAGALYKKSAFVNYLRAGLYGKRPMHLVPVCDVVGALLYLAKFKSSLNGNIFIISADDDHDNNYQQVESILMASMGLRARRYPIFPIPLFVLSMLLRLLGRTDVSMERRYVANKLIVAGFKRSGKISTSVREFALEFLANEDI